jgi:hypothetical protein
MSGFALISIIAMFLIEFQTFHTKCVHVFMISLHTKFHVPSFSGLLVNSIKLKAKGSVLHGHDLVILHSTTVAYFSKIPYQTLRKFFCLASSRVQHSF